MRISDWSSDVGSSDLPEERDVCRSRRRPRVKDCGPECESHATICRRIDSFLTGGRPARKCGQGTRWRVKEYQRQSGRTTSSVAIAATRRSLGYPTPTASEMRATTTRCRSEEHTSEFHSLLRKTYAVLCLKKKKK